jgi:RecB family exonuclease
MTYHPLMSVDVRWVAYGPPAAEALRSTISLGKGDEPLAPVTIIVPSNYVGVATRRLLASGTLGPLSSRGTGMAAVSFLTIYRLAELLGSAALAGRGRRPVSTPVIAAALRSSLAEEPGIFEPVADHAATETALISAYRELRDLSDRALDALATRSARAADVVRLHRAARADLETGFYDEEDLLDAATDAWGTDGAAQPLGTVIAYLPERLSRHSGTLLSAVGGTADLIVLAGTTGDPRADAEVYRSVRRIEVTAAGPSAGDGHLPAAVDRDRTQIVTVSDCDEEVRTAVRAIVDAARAGSPLDRIALLYASPEPYARLAYEQLSAAGIALNGAAVLPPAARVAGRGLLGLLALPERGFRREDVFAWLAGGQLRHDGHAVPVTAWERISRQAGVVAGRRDWDERLAVFATNKEEEAIEVGQDPDVPPSRAERLHDEAARARSLRQFVLGLIDDVSGAAGTAQRWSERVAWAHRHLHTLLGGERRRARWPVTEQKAAERVEGALDRLSTLDAVEGPVELAVFTRTLELELEADLGRVGRMGEGVLVGSVGMGVGLDLDLVVVLGLAEGLFPSPTHDDSLLPDHERAWTNDELPPRSEQVERQHRQLLAALAGASSQLLCVPRGDLRRNIDRVPSRWVLQIASAMAGERWWSEDLRNAQPEWLTHVASFDAGIRRLAFPATEQEHRLRSLMAQGSAQLPVRVLQAAGDGPLAAGAEVVAARRSDRFTRFDGNLAGLDLPSPAERATSATRLEGWATCPFAYLLHNILRVEEVENPEDELQITPRDKGSLVHEILERFIVEAIERSPSGRPWSAADAARLAEIAEMVGATYEAEGRTGRAIFWQRDRKRILADLRRFLQEDAAYRAATGTHPVAAELEFGMPGAELSAVALSLPDGRTVPFRGKADRVDVAADGALHVLDYKTGKADEYKDLSEDNPDDGGRRLQLPVYGQAARLFADSPGAAVRAEYWFVSARGDFTRVGYPVTPAVLAHVGATVGAVVEGIEAGVFPAHPTASSTTPWVECAYCDPDGMGVTQLRRLIERKQADPAMAPFVNFTLPAAAPAPDADPHLVPDV